MERFHYLHVGLALVLVFIGVKMLIEDLFHVPVGASLGVIAGMLVVSVVASLVTTKPEDGTTKSGDDQPP